MSPDAPGGEDTPAAATPHGEDTPAAAAPRGQDAPRRTYLAAERTWLAWWRTGLAVTVAAVGVGRIAPEVTTGADWPFVVLGTGYAVLAVALLAFAGARQRRVGAALASGEFAGLDDRWMAIMTGSGLLLAVATLGIVLLGA